MSIEQKIREILAEAKQEEGSEEEIEELDEEIEELDEASTPPTRNVYEPGGQIVGTHTHGVGFVPSRKDGKYKPHPTRIPNGTRMGDEIQNGTRMGDEIQKVQKRYREDVEALVNGENLSEEVEELDEASKSSYVQGMKDITDWSNQGYGDPAKILASAEKEHGAEFAQQLANVGKNRLRSYGTDPLALRKSPRVTKGNKANKQDINALKAQIRDRNLYNRPVSPVNSSYEYLDLPDISEDVAALVDGENLTEEFKQKAATIFESAVINRVKQEVAKLDEAYESRLEEEVESITEGLIEKVDGYLDYVVEQWFEQNEIALERGMKSEILENFVGGLKSLFEEHYIELPEEKFDVLGNMEETIEDLKARLDEQMESNVELNKEIATYQVAQVIADLSEGLVATDKEKFHALVEELVFDGVDSFARKAQTIRESYFTNKVSSKLNVGSVITDSPVTLSEDTVYTAPQMRAYTSFLNNQK